MNASPRVVGILRVLEVLDLHEEVEELVEALDDVNIDLEERLERLVALGVLVHRGVVDRVPTHDSILLRQNLTVTLDDVACIRLEDGYETQVKLAMSLDCVSVVLDSLHKLALLDVHCFHTETAFFLLQLVVHDFLKTHALKTEQADQAVVFALVGEDVVRVQALIVEVELVEDHVTWSSHLERQVHCDVLEAQMAANKRDELEGAKKVFRPSDACFYS